MFKPENPFPTKRYHIFRLKLSVFLWMSISYNHSVHMQSETNHYEILVIWTFFFYFSAHGHKHMAVGQVRQGQLSSWNRSTLWPIDYFLLVFTIRIWNLPKLLTSTRNDDSVFFPEDVFLERKLSIKNQGYCTYVNCIFTFILTVEICLKTFRHVSIKRRCYVLIFFSF